MVSNGVQKGFNDFLSTLSFFCKSWIEQYTEEFSCERGDMDSHVEEEAVEWYPTERKEVLVFLLSFTTF